MQHPKFGETLTNRCASVDNPQRSGMYVETKRRSGKRAINRGVFYRLTDGGGNFWEVSWEAFESPVSQQKEETP